jgi:hypothetical protein
MRQQWRTGSALAWQRAMAPAKASASVGWMKSSMDIARSVSSSCPRVRVQEGLTRISDPS